MQFSFLIKICNDTSSQTRDRKVNDFEMFERSLSFSITALKLVPSQEQTWTSSSWLEKQKTFECRC